MSKALYPGTFDPITLGHIDIIERAVHLFDHLVVTVVRNAEKGRSLFSEKERLDLIAHKFYNDSSKWFIIAKANKEITGNFYATPGKALVIPRID